MVKESKKETVATIADEKEEEYQTVGEILKNARLKNKLKIENVADKIRIRAQYLEAIENGDFRELPGPTYASGFVRTYASFLGLDSNAVYDRFRDEASGMGQKMSLAVMEPENEGGSPGKKEIILALVLLLIGYGLWYAFSSYEPASPAQEETIAEETVTEETPATDEVSQATEEASPASDEPVQITVSEDSYPAEETVKATEPAKTPEVSVKEETSAAVTEKPATPAEEAAPAPKTKTYGAEDDTSRVVIIANSETWLQVSKDNSILISRVLTAGDKYNVPQEEGLLLRTGNAGGLDIYVDGTKIAPIGPKGTIRSGILLDADALLLR
ncbi:MAG: helix-turn-helix domain-containing protein [Alphaproteobacteria bacterium]|nr:helix-turn-helix domain-containing protein [Alphaproteobacteria bacterium]